MLRYSRPKSQHWGHGCDRMSAVELLGKVDRFVRDQLFVVEGPTSRRTLEAVWQSGPADALAEAVGEIRRVLPAPTQLTESSQPDPMSFLNALNAMRSGRPVGGTLGGIRCRAVWDLTDWQLPVVAEWLDRFDATLARHPGAVFVHQHVGCQWLPHVRGGRAELAHPMGLGLVLTHLRHIQVPFEFYDADHYRTVRRYLAEIDLATLSDRSVLPRGALAGGATGGPA